MLVPPLPTQRSSAQRTSLLCPKLGDNGNLESDSGPVSECECTKFPVKGGGEETLLNPHHASQRSSELLYLASSPSPPAGYCREPSKRSSIARCISRMPCLEAASGDSPNHKNQRTMGR